MGERTSTGIGGLDDTIDGLRIGDNVVWRVGSLGDFAAVVDPFVHQARRDGRRLIHVRFGRRPALPGMEPVLIDPSSGFERFTIAVHDALTEVGTRGFYVFDPLADLHEHWHSDLLVMNFFKVICPYLFELDTIAYFALLRDRHTSATVAGIRETTQLLLDLHRIDDVLYVHPLKVWQRHSPTMFFPHRLDGGNAISVTSSSATTRLFSHLTRPASPTEPWQLRVDEAWDALESDDAAQEQARLSLLAMLVEDRGRMGALCERHLTLTDLLAVACRLVGTGSIGGKSVGMLAARAVLEHDPQGRFAEVLEPHDSFYVGSDVFVSFLVSNGWWSLWADHRGEAYFDAAARLHDLTPTGVFPGFVREEFLRLLEYFGQAPVIVRSSSLLEDNFGNAFAGKYDSVFLTNQGPPEERLAAFEDAVREVYASAVGEPALRYRLDRGLSHLDEEMALLVQRVSGDHHDGLFLPDAAGVANSSSPYVWAPGLPDEGMARLVVGLGTRAVERTGEDFARVVALADPSLSPVSAEDRGRFSQRRIDALDLAEGKLTTFLVDAVRRRAPRLPWSLVAGRDEGAARRMRELGRRGPVPEVVDFAGLLGSTPLPTVLREILATLSDAYDHPVDIEFTANVDDEQRLQVNLVQCRPLQTRGLGTAQGPPAVDPDRCVLATTTFMGGNARLPVDLAVLVRPDLYLGLGTSERYRVARGVGSVNRRLGGRSAMLIGPGRWGTTTPGLGVPAHFTDLNRFAVLVETTYAEGDFRPELSYGSHFFQELIETGIVYAAVLQERPGVVFDAARLTGRPNVHLDLVPDAGDLADVIHVAQTPGLVLHSDLGSQLLVVQPGD